MAQVAAAIFDRRDDAQKAVHALRDHGVDKDSISVLAMADDGSGKMSNMEEGERVPPPGKDDGISTTTPGDAAKGAAEGAAWGAGLGLAAALASVFIPGFGLVAAGGALATALSGAAIATAGGAITGGVTGYLMDLGVPDPVAHDYSETIKKGGVLVSVHDTDDASYAEIAQIFTKYNGRNAGNYDGTTTGAMISNPSALDAANSRLVHTSEADTDLDDDLTPSNKWVATDGDTLDSVSGSEGSASSRLSNTEVGTATSNLNSGVQPTTADMGSVSADATMGAPTTETTPRSLGDTAVGGQTPGMPGRTDSAMSVSSDVGTTAGYTGAGVAASDSYADRGAAAAGTAGGATAGANDKGIGDYESATRPTTDTEVNRLDLDSADTTDEEIDETMMSPTRPLSGATTGGTTNTGTASGGSRLTTSSDPLAGTATMDEEDETVR